MTTPSNMIKTNYAITPDEINKLTQYLQTDYPENPVKHISVVVSWLALVGSTYAEDSFQEIIDNLVRLRLALMEATSREGSS